MGKPYLNRYHLGEDERYGRAQARWRLLEELGIDQLNLQTDFIAVWKPEWSPFTCVPPPGFNPGIFCVRFSL